MTMHDDDKSIAPLYNKGMLVMWTMKHHKVDKKKARLAVEAFLEQERKRVPDINQLIDKTLEECSQKDEVKKE